MKRNWLEWLVLGLSVVAIGGLVAFLFLDGLSEETPPSPVAEIHLEKAHTSDLGWYAPVTVTNQGDEAAEAIVLEASADVDGSEEVSEVDIDYLPAGTDVEVEIGFSAEPDSEIQLRIVGFRLP
ncbi:MAG: hypothetical protein H0X16_01595 [Chloroflexi bacterium]|nr:hypothetical protein [Chloroflexota bacterium]